MGRRSEPLQAFVDAASEAFADHARDEASRRSVMEVFDAFEHPHAPRSGTGKRLPACIHLQTALAMDASPVLRRLIDSFAAIEPQVEWRRRSSDPTASANFEDCHANAMVLGPGGIEERRDAWLGATLMAPNVRYPDHQHSPEEVYLVMSNGEFRHGASDWFTPGVGGSFYNEPRILHAMRSLETPLFAFWVLRSADQPT